MAAKDAAEKAAAKDAAAAEKAAAKDAAAAEKAAAKQAKAAEKAAAKQTAKEQQQKDRQAAKAATEAERMQDPAYRKRAEQKQAKESRAQDAKRLRRWYGIWSTRVSTWRTDENWDWTDEEDMLLDISEDDGAVIHHALQREGGHFVSYAYYAGNTVDMMDGGSTEGWKFDQMYSVSLDIPHSTTVCRLSLENIVHRLSEVKMTRSALTARSRDYGALPETGGYQLKMHNSSFVSDELEGDMELEYGWETGVKLDALKPNILIADGLSEGHAFRTQYGDLLVRLKSKAVGYFLLRNVECPRHDFRRQYWDNVKSRYVPWSYDGESEIVDDEDAWKDSGEADESFKDRLSQAMDCKCIGCGELHPNPPRIMTDLPDAYGECCSYGWHIHNYDWSEGSCSTCGPDVLR